VLRVFTLDSLIGKPNLPAGPTVGNSLAKGMRLLIPETPCTVVSVFQA
jgi:hypothetical protein